MGSKQTAKKRGGARSREELYQERRKKRARELPREAEEK